MRLIKSLLANIGQTSPQPDSAKNDQQPADAPPFSLQEYEKYEPIVITNFADREVRFSTPNMMAKWRVDSLYQKEPVTIEWLKSFDEGDTLIDIGANVGMYSILAGIKGCRVFAFEPESQNYALLNKNIHLNGLPENVTAYCVAISDKQEFSQLYLSGFAAASSCHTFGENLDHNLEERDYKSFAQGSVSFSINELLEKGYIPMADHLKIDVDGLEHLVLSGASELLSNKSLKSILVELNTNLESHNDAIKFIEKYGFSYQPEQVEKALRKTGNFKDIGEFLFRR